MRIAVTGASGNVGTALLDRLAEHPEVESVVAVARRPPEVVAGPLGDRVEWVAQDIGADDAAEALAGALRGVDVVVHLAWLLQPSHDPEQMRRTNLHGLSHLLRAVADAGVPAVVHASSVGAYSMGPKDRAVDESWPTGGIPGSLYSRQKAAAERMLDRFSREHPTARVVRIRPGIVLARRAASEQARYFLGPFVPVSLIRRGLLPVVPALSGLALQVVHAQDVAAAFAAAALGDAAGAFNVATEPVLGPVELGGLLHARPVPFPVAVARGVADVTWRLRLQPTDPGWIDLATGVPRMSTARARAELGWAPERDAGSVLLEALAGVRSGVGGGTPVLRPLASPAGRLLGALRSVASGPGRSST